MKKIIIKNQFIVPIFKFLKELPLKPQASRGNVQFLKRLEEKQEDYNSNLKNINLRYFKVDENNDLVIDGEYYIFTKDDEDFKLLRLNEVRELDEETSEVSFAEHAQKYESLFKGLYDLDIELSGSDAILYDYLLEAYEINEEEE